MSRYSQHTPNNPHNGENDEKSWDTLNAHREYTKIYNALKDLEEHNVQISVPEFVFIGFQSSGKTSAVSQAAKLAVGTMKHGTASRCPTRFKLISNPKQEQPLIKVNGTECKNEIELTNKTLQITKQYEKEGIFSKNIIEVRIESAQVPELTFVDLPGLIKGNASQFATAKKQLDELTAFFLHDCNDDGTYRYMPILVREPVDIKHDTDFEVEYIDNLVETYGFGRKKRVGWRDDTLFIVNKFDKQINRSPASALISYMRYCGKYGETVLTIMNAHNDNTAAMSQVELNEFVDGVARCEEEKWNHYLQSFGQMNDENLNELRLLKEEMCGVAKMNSILTVKMCEIVKRILPFVEEQLDLAQKRKQTVITYIIKQIEMCDPQRLRQRCIAFNNKFIKYSRLFYTGQNVLDIDSKHNKTWSQDVSDFRLVAHSSGHGEATQWKYAIDYAALRSLLGKLSEKEAGSPAKLLSIKLSMRMIASAALNRMIEAWQCQVAYMSFPEYSDEDIANLAGGFDCTRQPDVWLAVRNILVDAVEYLIGSIHYLGEMFRYKLKENADIIFECTLLEEFGATNTDNLAKLYALKENNPILTLLKRTLRDYKLLIDVVIDEFLASAIMGPMDRTRVLDKALCEESICIGALINSNLKKISSSKEEEPKQQKRGKQQKQKQKQKQKAPSMLRRTTTFKYKSMADELGDISDEDVYNGNKSENKEEKYDNRYYEGIYAQPLRGPITETVNAYDVALVRHLSFVFWTNIKYLTSRDVIQKVSKIVMAPINHHDERVSNAIQCGVIGREIQALMVDLVSKTGIEMISLEKLVESKATIAIARAVTDIENEELERVYGINREYLMKERDKSIKSFKEFKKLKAVTLLKIQHIKNNDFDEIDKVFGDEYGIRRKEKEVSEHRVAHWLKHSITSQRDLAVYDIEDFILKKYKTFEEEEEEEKSCSDDDDEIAQLRDIDSEARAMQQEMAQMQDEQAAAMQDELNNLQNNNNNKKKMKTLQKRNSNLFRMRSGDKWNQNEIMKQKEEMQAHMVHLVDEHARSNSQTKFTD